MKGENSMLLIGIDKYISNKYEPLNNAVNDVERFRKILEDSYGFKLSLDPLYDEKATRENIIEALNVLGSSTTKDDNLIIYFAGHGGQFANSDHGFWVPVNWNRISDAVLNSTVFDLIEGIEAKHVLLISDSCFSGTFITKTREFKDNLTQNELEELNSRWVFTSGGEEPVSDGKAGKGSPFNKHLCEVLQNNQSSSLSIGEVFEAVIKRVAGSSNQTPLASQIKIRGNQGGQMVLRLRSNTLVTATAKLSFSLPKLPYEYYLKRSVTYFEYQKEQISYFYKQNQGSSPLLDVVLTEKRMVLLGNAGSGKSIELKRIAIELADPTTDYVPIYKRFNTYTGENIDSFLPKNWSEVKASLAVVLLDGLDEIQNKFFFEALRKILEFCDKYAEIKVVISCRTNFYELPALNFSGTLDGFSVYMLNDISLTEIRDYVSNQLELDGNKFIQEVYEASYIDIIQKPYFLNILTKYYLKSGSFPVNRAAIFEDALLVFYDQDREHFKTTGDFPNRHELFSLLEKVAFAMEYMGKNFIKDEELYRLFPSKDIYEKCKYLPTFKRQEAIHNWMFEHNNIQEFLAARVLSKKTFEKIIEIVSVESENLRRIKPTWVNTLSFFISINKSLKADNVLDWIANNDTEILIRFEPERIDKEKRIRVFQQIFEDYSEKQIWLSSNKFSDSDLAKFAYFEETIIFLLEKINANFSRITTLNAIRVLDNFNLDYFPNFTGLIKNSLFTLLDSKNFNKQDIYAILGAFGNLKITDNLTIEKLVKKFRNHKNQYIRAGLYKVLQHSNFVDDYIDVLVDGLTLSDINNPIDDRDTTNLMDESFYLNLAIQKIKTPTGLKILLNHFAKDHTNLYLSDYKEILEAIIKNSIEAYKKDASLYLSVCEYFLFAENSYGKKKAILAVPFFDLTNTRKDVFDYIVKNPEISNYEKSELIELLMNEEIIYHFIELYKSSKVSQDDANLIYKTLFWAKDQPDFKKYLQQLEDTAKKCFETSFYKPELNNWDLINKNNKQISFDLLFNKEQFLKEVEKIFSEIGKETLSNSDLFDHRAKLHNPLEDTYVLSAVELVRGLTFNERTINLDFVRQFFKSQEFDSYQIKEIYEYLNGDTHKYIQVRDYQLKFISKWCQQKQHNFQILWFFIHRFNIRPLDLVLNDLLFYYDFSRETKFAIPGTLEMLEAFIPRETLKKKVAANLEKQIENRFSWLSNAGYALRNNINHTYPSILARLETETENEYKFNEILEFWFEKTQDSKRLSVFIEKSLSETLRWRAIALLSESKEQREFLGKYLKKVIANKHTSKEYQFAAANYLMLEDDLEGFNFCVSEISKELNPHFDFRHNLKNMPKLKNADAIANLMKLLYISKQSEFQLDKFNNLEPLVIDTIYNIGIQSTSNFILVKEAILRFIVEHQSTIEHLNFLHFTIKKIEEQIYFNKSQDYSIEEAILEWDKTL